MADPVRWGVLGTANIAARAFLPALRESGGVAVAVGSRSTERARSWARDNGVDRAGSYESVVTAADVDAVYVALPNDQHAEWTAAAAAAGKAVLCEKPLTLTADQAADLLVAVGPDALVWESFVFPFHPQTALIADLVDGGRIGELREIVSEFHFDLGPGEDNIRLRPELGGGALYDVGCYPVRLARLLFGSEPISAATTMRPARDGVELDVAAVLDFPDDRRLVLSAGMRRPMSTFTRLIGSAGELRVTNPFHPREHDTVELRSGGALVEAWPAAPGTAFRHAVDHIGAVLTAGSTPRHRVADDSLGQARALDLVRAAAPGIPS